MGALTLEQAIAECATFHQLGAVFAGFMVLPHVKYISRLCRRVNASTMLDYGCGKGKQYVPPYLVQRHYRCSVTKYDPAWPRYAAEPKGKFDVVICTHVLGSVPINDLPSIIDRLYDHATKAVYIGEYTGPMKKPVFSTTEGLPVEKNEAWWIDMIRRPAKHNISTLVGFIQSDKKVKVRQI